MPLLTFAELGTGIQKSAGSIREDLLDFIENISPADTPLYNNLGQIQVNAGYVEYLEDTLAAAAANAFVEGAAATDQTLATPSRNASIVQIFRKDFHVSGRQEAVNHAGMASMLTYQEIKKAKEIKRDIELALHRGSAVSGTSTVAPQFNGLLNVLSTLATSSSGTTLTESVFNDLLSLAFSYNVNLREVYCNMYVKRTINGYSTNVTRQIDAQAKRQLNLVDVYDSEVGTLAVFKSRDQLQAASKAAYGNSFVAIDPDYFQVGWLRPLKTVTLGLDGDRTRKMMIGELTLIVRSEKAGVCGQGYVANI